MSYHNIMFVPIYVHKLFNSYFNAFFVPNRTDSSIDKKTITNRIQPLKPGLTRPRTTDI